MKRGDPRDLFTRGNKMLMFSLNIEISVDFGISHSAVFASCAGPCALRTDAPPPSITDILTTSGSTSTLTPNSPSTDLAQRHHLLPLPPVTAAFATCTSRFRDVPKLDDLNHSK